MGLTLVTGAAGCIGSNLVRRLVGQGEDVRIFIKPGSWHPFLDGLELDVCYGDIRDSNLNNVVKSCNKIYQVAGVVSYNRMDNLDMYTTHVKGVRNVLEAAINEDVEKIIVTASTAGIGIPQDPSHPLNEKSAFDPKYRGVMYMFSKNKTIQLCREFAQKGLDVSAVSPTTVYGQGDTKMHIGKLIRRIQNGKIKYAPPGGNAVVSVDDIVDAHLLTMSNGRAGENYIFSDEFIPYFEMFNRIANVIGADFVKRTLPPWILEPSKYLLGGIELAASLIEKKPLVSPASLNFSFKYRYFDSSKARDELGWKPSVGFEESIMKAAKFYADCN